MSIYQLVPYLLAWRATEVFDNSTCDVEHHVDPQSKMAGQPKAVMDTKRDEQMRPFHKNGSFEQHYDDTVKDVVVVHILQRCQRRPNELS